MRLIKLQLLAFGQFTGKVLDFGVDERLTLVYGPNEAGKSSTLRAIADLRFGFRAQSVDNFIHKHSELRVGGEFVDTGGRRYSLMRRKGRGATLHFWDFSNAKSDLDQPVPAQVETLLTCGLSREDYELMFGLDHERLRAGGQALLRGEGEVGAALFEASAGVRSIPEVLERLEESARKLFIGGRGRNAKINEALTTYELQQLEFRQAIFRPAHWADLFKKHETAAADLVAVQQSFATVEGNLFLVRELRGVAPFIGTLNIARQTLSELQAAQSLSISAAEERAAAESGLETAKLHEETARKAYQEHADRLNQLKLDDLILAVAPAVRRLVAAADTIDKYRGEIADAEADWNSAIADVDARARQIDPKMSSEQVLSHLPGPTSKAAIDGHLRAVEESDRELRQFLAPQQDVAHREEGLLTEMPASDERRELRLALAEVTRCDAELKRLNALPREISAARRSLSAALTALGISDDAALQRLTTMLSSQIDKALQEATGNQTRQEELQSRIAQIETETTQARHQQIGLHAQGAIATRGEVLAAREHRELGWALVRGTYIDNLRPSIDYYVKGQGLTDVYEKSVRNADQLGDILAKDIARAAQVEVNLAAIATLERDLGDLHSQLQELEREEAERGAAWDRTVIASGLPVFSPAALREWQMLIPSARGAQETLQARLDEQIAGRELEQGLAIRLKAAILNVGIGVFGESQTLGTLTGIAVELLETFAQGEARINQAVGKAAERERQQNLRNAQETRLRESQNRLTVAAQSVYAELLLPGASGVVVARARTAEFEALAEAAERRTAAKARRLRAVNGLGILSNLAAAIWHAVGDAEPADLRVYGEQANTRLERAENIKATRALAEQAADTAKSSERQQAAAAARYAAILAGLCQAAKVDSSDFLVEAENRSRRKREAQETFDSTRKQLGVASQRSIEELQTLLANRDAAQLHVDEESLAMDHARISNQLVDARKLEDQTRRDLECIDGSDLAAVARDGMERSIASIRTNLPPWIRVKLAHAILTEALKKFRERTQGPMLKAASQYFQRMTRDEFIHLSSDESGDEPILIAERHNHSRIEVDAMSEGTRDQLYLALRLAAIDIRRASGVNLPVLLDDVLITSDDERSEAILNALSDFGKGNQLIVFTHHRHIRELAIRCLSLEKLVVANI